MKYTFYVPYIRSCKFYEVADNEIKVTPYFSEFPIEIFNMLTNIDPPILPHENKRRETNDCILTALEKYVFRPIDEIRLHFYFTVCDTSEEGSCNIVYVLIQ